MKQYLHLFSSATLFAIAALVATPAMAAGLPTHAELSAALKAVVTGGGSAGFGLNMWATIVNRDGEVSNIAFSGNDRGDQWPGSRAISAQKANTANSFSLPTLALSTANLYSATQPGGTLFGLQESNPMDTAATYKGPSENYGKANDPLVGYKCGGVNVFGGGLALYSSDGKLLGALGVSGDTSCTDHIIAWKIRHMLNLDKVPAGVSATGDDNIVHDIVINGTGHPQSASGWGHPGCGGGEEAVAAALPVTHPIGPLVLLIALAPDLKVRLSWPTASGGLVLQETASLAPASWKAVDATPTVEGNLNVATLTPPATRFYRLLKLQ